MVCLAARPAALLAMHASASAIKLSAAVSLVLIVEGSCQKPSSTVAFELLKKLGKTIVEK